MYDSHYQKSFDSLSKIEEDFSYFTQIRSLLSFIIEKYDNGDDVENFLSALNGYVGYAEEKMDANFTQAWAAIIAEHPSRLPNYD